MAITVEFTVTIKAEDITQAIRATQAMQAQCQQVYGGQVQADFRFVEAVATA